MATANEVTEFHNRSDVDSSRSAQHHTIGYGENQSAPGSDVAKLLKLVEQGAFGRVGDVHFSDSQEETEIWKRPNGQLLSISDYPEAYAFFQTKYGGDGVTTFALPDYQGKKLVMQDENNFWNALHTVGSTFGNMFLDLDHEHTVPGHTHTIPAHNHSVPAHNHTIERSSLNLAANTSTGGTANRITNGEDHHHGGATGNSAVFNTGNSTTADSGSTSVDTDGYLFTAPSAPLFGNSMFVNASPTIVTNCFIRVRLGL